MIRIDEPYRVENVDTGAGTPARQHIWDPARALRTLEEMCGSDPHADFRCTTASGLVVPASRLRQLARVA